jgi:hypothetical protein
MLVALEQYDHTLFHDNGGNIYTFAFQHGEIGVWVRSRDGTGSVSGFTIPRGGVFLWKKA